MATNRIFENTDRLTVTVTHPAAPNSGDPCRWGERVGVALNDEVEHGDLTGKTTVQFDGVFDVSVKGIDGSGNSTVAVGDKLYYTDADTPPLSKKATGRYAGYAMEAVTSGATATIRVAFTGA